ncbi:MAG: type III pantothenate kinase [bacterium]
MLLATDIGNTHITIGIFSKDKLVGHWRFSSGVNRTEDECWIMVNILCQSQKLDISDITGCVISSVVPDQTPIYATMAEKQMGVATVVVNSDTDSGLKILYHDPSSVGADRICNSVAGFNKYGGPLIIIDFGTATTFDIVSENAEYLGGIIAPGVESSSYALYRYAARLPRVELKFPDHLIAKTTETSMQAGIMYGIVEMVNGLVRRLTDELGKKAQIITTGGMAEQIFEKLQLSVKLEPFLTLDGLRLIYERVMTK